MGNDPKQGEDFVKVPVPRETDDVEGHKQGIDSSEDFVKVPVPRESDLTEPDDDTEGHKV